MVDWFLNEPGIGSLVVLTAVLVVSATYVRALRWVLSGLSDEPHADEAAVSSRNADAGRGPP